MAGLGSAPEFVPTTHRDGSPSGRGDRLGTAMWAAGWDGTVPYSCVEDRGAGPLLWLCRSRLVPGQAARALVLLWEHVNSQSDPTSVAAAILPGKG